jgi:hypothetical protein
MMGGFRIISFQIIFLSKPNNCWIKWMGLFEINSAICYLSLFLKDEKIYSANIIKEIALLIEY